MAIKSDQEPLCLKAGTISKLASRGFFYGISANESQSYYTTILIPPGSEDQSSNKTYSPDVTTIRLAENETIRWVNQANVTDTLVADTPFEQFGIQFGSPALHPGESYEFTFATVGTYGYHDKSHPWQKGTIHVLGHPSSIKLDKVILNKTDSALGLYLTSSPDTIKPGQTVDITISINNTSKNPIQVDAQDAWSFGNVQTGVCARIGYGISVLDGYYTTDNLTKSTSMQVFNPGVLCPFIAENAQRYEFQPASDMVKEIKCDQTQNRQCNPDPYPMGHSYSFSGYWDSGKITPFKSGMYTIVGADEWGHVEIRHFVVTGSTIPSGFGSASCDTSYAQPTGIPVLYMPANSTGKICVQYANSNPPVQEGIRIFEAHDIVDNAQGVSVFGTPEMIPTGNSTVVYTITAGNHVGFYGLTIFCVGMPFAIGYDGNSTFVQNDFPWYGDTYYCPAQFYNYHIVGLSGIGVKYIPYP
jgi:plastocyanin